MRKIIYWMIFLFFINGVNSQGLKTDKEQFRDIQRYNYQKSIFNLVHKSWIGNQNISNFSVFSPISSIKSRRIDLREGEGLQNNFFLLEGNLNLQFPLFFGRKDIGSGLRRLNKLTLDYGTNFRMILDESKPLTTPNNKVGFSWHFNLWNNYSSWIWRSYKEEYESDIYLFDRKKKFKFWNFITTIHHYSNGQSGESIIYENQNDKTGETRNNYKNGDFSTNYLYFELTKGAYELNNFSLRQYSIGYRFDWEFGNALAFSEAQIDSYGKQRIFLKYDFRSGNMSKFRIHFRTELAYIFGNLEKFKANLKNNDKKYRFSIKSMIELTPKSHRSVGYFISGYYGRDYLNIRYDDIIYTIQWGLTLSLDKYFAPEVKY